MVHDEIFDAGQHVGVEVGDGFQPDGFHQQVVQAGLALQLVHFYAFQAFVVVVGRCPDAAGQQQSDECPEPRALPQGRAQVYVDVHGRRGQGAYQGLHFQPVAAGQEVVELHFACRLRLRPLVLKSLQPVTVADVARGRVGHGNEGEAQVAHGMGQRYLPGGDGQGLPVYIVGRGFGRDHLQPGHGVLIHKVAGAERDGLAHARYPHGAVVGLGDVGNERFDAGEAVVAVEEHRLQQPVFGDVQSVDHSHDEVVVARLANGADGASVVLEQDGGVVAHGIELFTRGQEYLALRGSGHGGAGNALVGLVDGGLFVPVNPHGAVGGAHVQVAVSVGAGAEDAAQPFVRGADATPAVGHEQLLSGGHEQAVAVCGEEAVVEHRQVESLPAVAFAGQYASAAQQVGGVADAGCVGVEEVVIAPWIGSRAQFPGRRAAQQFAVERADCQQSPGGGVDGAQDVVVVGQRVVHEVQLEEVVHALVGGEPDVAFAVDEHLSDEVDAVHQLLHLPCAGVEAVQAMRVVQVDVALAVGAGFHAVVGCREAERCHPLGRSPVATVHPVGGKEVERAVRAEQCVALWHEQGGQSGAVGLEAVGAFGGGDIEGAVCRVGKHAAAGVHLVKQGRAQHGFRPVVGEAADFALFFLLVFQQQVAGRQCGRVEVVQQQSPVVQRTGVRLPVFSGQVLAAEAQGGHSACVFVKADDVLRPAPLQVGHELEAVVAHESGEGAYPDVPLFVLVDALGEHLRQAVKCGVVAAGVFRGNGCRLLCGDAGGRPCQQPQRQEQAGKYAAYVFHLLHVWRIYLSANIAFPGN